MALQGALLHRRTEKEDVLDEKIRQMLRDLGKALSSAIAESSDVNQALRRIHEEGYSLFIFLDRKDRDDRGEPAGADEAEDGEAALTRTSRPRGEPVFLINGGDLSFLRSIGIDPTRRVRRRKSS